MPLEACLKRLSPDEDLYVLWPYQRKALCEVWYSIDELSEVLRDADESNIDSTLRIISSRFGEIIETMDERIPRNGNEEVKGG